MAKDEKKFIPIGYLPYGEGYHFILRTDQPDPDYYTCLYPEYELGQISSLKAQDLFVAHNYKQYEFDGDSISKDELNLRLSEINPEQN